MANVIITENLNTGSSAWKPSSASPNFIQAYADKVSYNPGDIVTFFVSTQVGGTTYTFSVYRLGYYGGTGGCLKFTSGILTGVAQGYWDGATLNNCPTAIIDSSTHLTEAGWASSTTWTIPGNAVTGIYTALFTDQNGKNISVVFIVKGNAGADYCFVRGTATDQAYNTWGGWSLYTNPTVGVKVSYNRPCYIYGGSPMFNYEINFIQWVEQQGYNLTYYTDIDIHVTPSLLLASKVILSTGHDEYWTKERRDGWEAALAKGVSSAFMSANICYWQARLEADASSTPNRTLTCYKVTGGNLALDPLFGVDNTRVTGLWRNGPVSRPENTMIGIMYNSFDNGGNMPWTVDGSADTTYFAGTGLVASSSYGSDLVGYEWDKIQSGSPAGLMTIGTSTTHNADTSNTTWYRHASGALVFATGSVGWTSCLNSYRWTGSAVAPVPQMQTLLANVMGALKGPVFSMTSV